VWDVSTGGILRKQTEEQGIWQLRWVNKVMNAAGFESVALVPFRVQQGPVRPLVEFND
jgi:hypothetical protein